MTQSSNGGPLGYPAPPTGQPSMAAAVKMENCNCDGATKSSTVISDRTSGSSQPSSKMSPKVNGPAHRRNK